MHKILKVALLGVSSVFYSGDLLAGRMGNLIQQLGEATNFNEAGSFESQSTGHYAAGGMMIRQSNKTVAPINIRMPDLKIGGSCGNFDMRFGGIGFIQGQALVDMLKRTAQGVPAYAFQLALKTVAPQIEGAMSRIQTILQKANDAMLNECWMRQQMMEGILPKNSAIHGEVCKEIEASGNNESIFGARENCRSASKRTQAIESAKSKYKDQFIGEYNLVWTVLKKMPRYEEDNNRAEMIMSLVGTVVSRKFKNDYIVQFIEPQGDSTKFLEAYLQGGTTTALVCDETSKCLKPTYVKDTILPADALAPQLVKTIGELRWKYLQGEAFTTSEKNFLGDAVNVPIYKYIQISAATGIQWPLGKVSSYLALSMLLHNFDEAAAELLKGLTALEAVQIDGEVIKQFKKRLELARSRLHHKMSQADGRERWMLEKVISAKEAELRSNQDYEGGL